MELANHACDPDDLDESAAAKFKMFRSEDAAGTQEIYIPDSAYGRYYKNRFEREYDDFRLIMLRATGRYR